MKGLKAKKEGSLSSFEPCTFIRVRTKVRVKCNFGLDRFYPLNRPFYPGIVHFLIDHSLFNLPYTFEQKIIHFTSGPFVFPQETVHFRPGPFTFEAVHFLPSCPFPSRSKISFHKFLHKNHFFSRIAEYSTAHSPDAAYIIGGISVGNLVAEFKNGEWRQLDNLNKARDRHASITVGSQTMIVGGAKSTG